jgi:hypothetical protein
MPRRKWVTVELTPIGRLVDATAHLRIEVHDRSSSLQHCCITYPTRSLEKAKLNRAAFRTMLISQDGVCAMCGRGNYPGPLFIDHDHVCCNKKWTCGKCVRGLLCSHCNTWLIDVELDRNREKYTEQWWANAVTYLTARGCDPANQERLATHIDIHRRRRIAAGVQCSCRYCVAANSPAT